MVRYGFVIDQSRCIGCHACTVACKEENRVPLGVFRTWVKYIEEGQFPDTTRSFSVMRCNHCDDAPCVEICPTKSLFTRDDGIVDFDNRLCIGCKSCMLACPYDALYIDPNTQTAGKCNFCAHRVEVGLEPACVIVCPVQAIIAGDIENPETKISKTLKAEKVDVRKPEQKTKPKLWYVGVNEEALVPRAAEEQVWSFDETAISLSKPTSPCSGKAIVAYDVPHERAPWGWQVSSYLFTKSIAAGAMLLAGLATGLGWADWVWGIPAAGIGLAFLTITMLLLVGDLKRPERFLYILLKPNWKSWLVWGSYILMLFGAATSLWLINFRLPWTTMALGIFTACYSAFLFGQCEGRDFWQSPLLFFHLLAASIVAGASALLFFQNLETLQYALGAGLILNVIILMAELFVPRKEPDANRAAKIIWTDPRFWWGTIVIGAVLPFFLLLVNFPLPAAALALAGLWCYEDQWIRAGQAIPLS